MSAQELHESDVGFMLCRAVEVVCKEGPAHVLELAQMGANFTRSRNGSLHLTREGGHRTRRVVHAEDATGMQCSTMCSLLPFLIADGSVQSSNELS